MQLDPEPRKRRRRANTNEEEQAPAPQKPSKSSRRTSPGMRGKENIPAIDATKSGTLKQARQPRNGGALTTTPAASASAKVGLKPPPSTQPIAKQAALPSHNHGAPPRSDTANQPQPIQPRRHAAGSTKTSTTAASGPQSQPKPAPSHSPFSASPANPRGAALPSTDRNIDKVVLGDICFRAWYPSYYGKDVLGDFSSPSTSTNPSSHQPPPGGSSSSSKAGSKDGAKGHARHNRDPPPMLDRLCVCPCCFKYSKELVSWWEHVRICEARAHVPGRKIYVHPKGQRTVTVPAPGTAAVSRPGKGVKRGSASAKMVEEVLKDEGEWSIWEVDGEKEGVSLLVHQRLPLALCSIFYIYLFTNVGVCPAAQLFCQNLSLFAKLFLDNKSVFFDVTGFNYFLLVYTPPPPPSPPPTKSPASSGLVYPSPDDNDSHHLPLQRQHIVGFFSKEKMSWDNNNLACILIFPPWQRKGLGALLMGVSYEISRREGVMGGPEKPISDLGKKGYKRFWAGEVARWLLGLEPNGGEDGDADAAASETVVVVDVEACSQGTWIAPEDCLVALREMGVVEDAGMGADPRRVREKGEEEGEAVEEVKEVHRVGVDKEAVRRWVVANGISLERTCDPGGFVEGYAMKAEEEENEG